jgi:hypothetical protein
MTASNPFTQRCVFHRATYKDVDMALNLNRLIVSAPPFTYLILKLKKVTVIATRITK